MLHPRRLSSLIRSPNRTTEHHEKVLYEIHYRVPRHLNAPFLASHFTQCRQSREDTFFNLSVNTISDGFSAGAIEADQQAAADDAEAVFGNEIDRLDGLRRACRSLPAAMTVEQVNEFNTTANNLYAKIRLEYEHVRQTNGALFVFGATDQILNLIIQNVTDESGPDPILDAVFNDFQTRFKKYFPKRAETLFNNITPIWSGQTPTASDEFGGIVSWIEAQYGDNQINERLNSIYDDFKHIYIHNNPIIIEPDSKLNYQIRWSRFPQAWNYTFIETLIQGRNQTRYIEALRSLIFSAALTPSVAAARVFQAPPDNLEFPGQTLAGAHYLMLPIDDLIHFSILGIENADGSTLGTADILTSVQRMRWTDDAPANNFSFNDLAARLIDRMTDNRQVRLASFAALIVRCLDALSAIELNRIIEQHFTGSVASGSLTGTENAIINLFRTLDQTSFDKRRQQELKIAELLKNHHDDIRMIPFCFFLGNLVKRAIEMTSHKKEIFHTRILELLADFTTIFWQSTLSIGVEDDMRSVSNDYVCSSMIDGRCLYFSNFMPFGREEFTRTIFVDLGMSPHQRARMLQRLCDLLTYRSNPLRDLDRVKAAIDALNQFNRDLNDIQMRMTGRNSDGSPDALDKRAWAQKMQELHYDMDDILRISSLIGRMNAFITYGVSGKWYSADAYFKQIRERCEDLREVGIPGYAQLDDFVQRRLAHSMRFVERMYMHHTTVGQRLSELMDSVRTQLQAFQTRKILENLQEQTAMVSALKVASNDMKNAADQIGKDLRQQTKLQETADILIFVAGTYYISQMIKTLELFKLESHVYESVVTICISFIMTGIIRVAGIRLIRFTRNTFF